LHGVGPDPATGTDDQNGLAGLGGDGVNGRQCRGTGQWQSRRSDEVDTGGLGGHGCGGKQGVLGDRTGLDRRGQQDGSDDLVPDGDVVDTRADLFDDR
jgi:hypothetical protein